jgi:hypothetical protein
MHVVSSFDVTALPTELEDCPNEIHIFNILRAHKANVAGRNIQQITGERRNPNN